MISQVTGRFWPDSCNVVFRSLTFANVEVNPAALSEIIERTGYRKSVFASEVGISPSYLTEMTKGSKPGSPDVIKRMAAVLRCPMSALIKDPDGPIAEAS